MIFSPTVRPGSDSNDQSSNRGELLLVERTEVGDRVVDRGVDLVGDGGGVELVVGHPEAVGRDVDRRRNARARRRRRRRRARGRRRSARRSTRAVPGRRCRRAPARTSAARAASSMSAHRCTRITLTTVTVPADRSASSGGTPTVRACGDRADAPDNSFRTRPGRRGPSRAGVESCHVPVRTHPGSVPMPVTVVVGAQWGDEGKAKIIDLLVEGAHLRGALPGWPQRRSHRGRRRSRSTPCS